MGVSISIFIKVLIFVLLLIAGERIKSRYIPISNMEKEIEIERNNFHDGESKHPFPNNRKIGG